jgi:hypothetical protein
MVLVSERHTRQEIGETLSAHGADHVGFFGKWTVEALATPPIQDH